MCILFEWIPALMHMWHFLLPFFFFFRITHTTGDKKKLPQPSSMTLDVCRFKADFFHSCKLLYGSEFTFHTPDTMIIYIFLSHSILWKLNQSNGEFSISSKITCLLIFSRLSATTFTLTLSSSWKEITLPLIRSALIRGRYLMSYLNLSSQGPQRKPKFASSVTSLEVS